MSNAKYKFELFIIPNSNGSNDDKPTERLETSIHSFEVDGGAKRKVELNSGDASISSEFEQARIYKNIIFYIPPTKDFLGVKLMDIASNMRFFNFTFVVTTYVGRLTTQTLRLHCVGAWFFRLPSPIGSTPPLLKAQVRFHEKDVTLLHGQFDPKRKKLVHREV